MLPLEVLISTTGFFANENKKENSRNRENLINILAPSDGE
jgi:hypothetical protein